MTGESSVANSFNTLFGSSSGPTDLATVLPRNKLTLRFCRGSCGLLSWFVRFAVAVRVVCGRGSCGRSSCKLWSRFVRFAGAVRTICGCGLCGFFTDRRKPWRRVPTFPDYNGYHTLSNYKIYISILRLYL
jgi:hypothetical protein